VHRIARPSQPEKSPEEPVGPRGSLLGPCSTKVQIPQNCSLSYTHRPWFAALAPCKFSRVRRVFEKLNFVWVFAKNTRQLIQTIREIGGHARVIAAEGL
jgi:hypothetical protein